MGRGTALKLPNLRDFARGQPCTIRIPGVCNFDESTTVLCHDRSAGVAGIGQKPCDLNGAHGCSACHDVTDGRVKTHYTLDERRAMFADAKSRTLERVWRYLTEGA